MENMTPEELNVGYTFYTEEFTRKYKEANPNNDVTYETLKKICEKVWKVTWDSMSDEKKNHYFVMSCLEKDLYLDILE